jgi:hypothetical protein
MAMSLVTTMAAGLMGMGLIVLYLMMLGLIDAIGDGLDDHTEIEVLTFSCGIFFFCLLIVVTELDFRVHRFIGNDLY